MLYTARTGPLYRFKGLLSLSLIGLILIVYYFIYRKKQKLNPRLISWFYAVYLFKKELERKYYALGELW